MDLGCYGLHIMRRLGHPSIVRAHAKEHRPGVDAWCDVELTFPNGATGLSTNSMVADDYAFTIQIVGTTGDVHVHNFIKPHEDDRVTVRTPAGTTVEHLGTRPRTPISWRRSPGTCLMARRCRSTTQTQWRTWRTSTPRTARQVWIRARRPAAARWPVARTQKPPRRDSSHVASSAPV